MNTCTLDSRCLVYLEAGDACTLYGKCTWERELHVHCTVDESESLGYMYTVQCTTGHSRCTWKMEMHVLGPRADVCKVLYSVDQFF